LRYCQGSDDEPHDWHAGVAGSYVTTHLKITANGRTDEADFARYAMTLSLDRRVGDRWTIGAALGSALIGSLDIVGKRYVMTPGPIAVATASFRAVDEGSIRPFVLFTGSIGAALVWTRPDGGSGTDSMTSFDARLGVAAGKTFGGVATPYVLARAFGGPVLWSYGGASATGTDAYHYQLGAGLVVRSGAYDLVVEGVPLGEKALVLGIGWVF
jgi:hypothetical protein